MQGELRLRTLQLEGDLFKLMRKYDREISHVARIAMQDQIHKARVQLMQYQCCLDEFQKQEELKRIKRKMRRGPSDA